MISLRLHAPLALGVVLSLLSPLVMGAQAAAPTWCPQATPIWSEYWVHLAFAESPFEEIRGTTRITASEAATRNHYRLDRDREGRVVRVTFALGDTPRIPNHTGNALSEAPIVEVCPGTQLERRRFRDAHGNPILIRGNVAEERYTLDSLGYRRVLTFHDPDGVAIENGWGISRYTWEIEKDGTVIEERFDAAGQPAEIRPGFPFFRIRLSFGANGWIALMENIDSAGRLVENDLAAAQDKLEYRASGEMLAWNVYDGAERRSEGNGPRVARGIREFDASGYEAGEWYLDRNGQRIANAYGFFRSRATFDRFGNMLSRFNHDSTGARLPNELTGYAGYVYRWDATGLHELEVGFRGIDGEPVNHSQRGYHRRVNLHDAAGDLVETRFEDVAGRLVNRTDNGIARIVHRHDERHRLVETRWYDAAGAAVAVNGEMVRRVRYRPDGYPVP